MLRVQSSSFPMCGIAGFAGEDEEKIRRMVAALRHRGPDNQAWIVTHGASIGNARLAILDPRPEGNQPMWNDAHTALITFNGEIFNFRTLRAEENFTCRTNTDTEVMLKLYEKYGMDFLPRLRGMFSFGLYDTQKRMWHIARGASGILPLFIAYPEGKLHFASEMHTLLLAFKKKPPLNFRSLSRYVRLQYVPGPETLCEGIESLPPGTILSWHEGKETRQKFTPQVETPMIRSKREFKEKFPALMEEVVKDHLLSDRPVGLFLSGGMDSSTVLHHMSSHQQKPRTFTVRFEATEEEGEKRFNTDADLAKITAEHYGTTHTEIFLTANLCRNVYRDTARALDQPNADSTAMAQFVLAREAKKTVDVVVCGAAGDELFGGYPRYRIARVLHTLRFAPPSLRSVVGKIFGYPSDVLALSPGPLLAERLLARPIQECIAIVKGHWFDPHITTRLFEQRFSSFETHRLCHGEGFCAAKSSRTITGGAPQDDKQNWDPIRTFMEFDRHTWLIDESLRLADATLMASGVECRVPFTDSRVVAISHACPSSWHVTPWQTKALLKATYRPLLPPHLFSLSKASFFPPLAKWIRRECRPLIEEALEHPRIQELFKIEVLREVFKKHLTSEAYGLHPLSSVLQLSHWFDTVYDG